MWDSLPWFVQLAVEIGSIVFLYTVTTEAVLRTMRLILTLKYPADEALKIREEMRQKAEKPQWPDR